MSASALVPDLASEDTEYVHRAYLNKIPVIYVPDLIVYHFHGSTTVGVVRKQYSGYAVGNAMYAKYFFSRGGLSRHLYWDLRKAFREMIAGDTLDEGSELQTMGLSHRFHIRTSSRGWRFFGPTPPH